MVMTVLIVLMLFDAAVGRHVFLVRYVIVVALWRGGVMCDRLLRVGPY